MAVLFGTAVKGVQFTKRGYQPGMIVKIIYTLKSLINLHHSSFPGVVERLIQCPLSRGLWNASYSATSIVKAVSSKKLVPCRSISS